MWIFDYFHELWIKILYGNEKKNLQSIQYPPEDMYDINTCFQYGSTSEIF